MIKIPEFENDKGPILMLNMVKFKDRKRYFEEYLPAFSKVTKLLGFPEVNVKMTNDVLGNIIADEHEVWDAIVLVEYPSVSAFKKIAFSDEYRDIALPYRLAALDDMKLYMTINP